MKQLESQADVCTHFGAAFEPPNAEDRLGIALESLGELPLNALRYPPESGTCGWYVWGGGLSQDPEFFKPLCVSHLGTHAAQLVPFLALPPGWRVLLAPGQVEAWQDQRLIDA